VTTFNKKKEVKICRNICNSVVEPLATHIFLDYDLNKFNILIVLIAFYGLIFFPRYILNTHCEPEDDLKLVETCSYIQGIHKRMVRF
jgi:hypothetical protein